jgi:hypothetical protein
MNSPSPDRALTVGGDVHVARSENVALPVRPPEGGAQGVTGGLSSAPLSGHPVHGDPSRWRTVRSTAPSSSREQ